NEIKISGPGNEVSNIRIVDLSGKTVCQEAKFMSSIDISFLEQGIYFIIFEHSGQYTTKRFVKK
ncbi:MAG: T9SS type A sorting domain-containing protein, partial [Draconibacterium sp.]|nr:T9SS type A sorting domain-containing protein [Draconibacterium sp.]